MEEADAFTAEIVEAFRRAKTGQPEYLGTLRAKGGRVMKHAEKFLEKHPYESFSDDGAFAQGMFAHIMQGGIDHYSANYFKDYGETFEKAKTLREFRDMLDKDPQPPKDKPSPGLLALYGGNISDAKSLAALSPVFLDAQAEKVKETLDIIERTAKRANKLTSKEYLKARQKILKRSADLRLQFNKKSADDRPKVISGEELQQKLKKKPALNAGRA